MSKANPSITRKGRSTRPSRNMRFAVAASPARSPSAMAPTRRSTSTALKRPVASRIWSKRRPSKARRCCLPTRRACAPSRAAPHGRPPSDGTKPAGREPYLEQAETIEGQTMLLTDAESLCAFARFCDPKGRIWNLVKQTDNAEARRLVEYEAGHCPAGRLVAWDRKTGKAIEPKFEPSLGLIEDTAKQVSGPIWVRGGIPVVSADGKAYEIRNRLTLCRCGKSANKPFCDGAHAA